MLSLGAVGTFGPVNDVELWVLRAVWLLAPFASGPVFTAALDEADDAFRIGVGVGLWAVWAALLVVLMVPRTWSLTTIRIALPAAVPAFVWAVVAAGEDARSIELALGGFVLTLAAGLGWRAPLADRFVDGSSYGDENRFLLRTPGPLVVGPLALVWAVTVLGATGGILLLLAERWILGPITVLAGVPMAWFGVQAIHRLSNRWLVFVPAGVVVHDKTALREPQLFRKVDVEVFGPAPIDAPEEDLTLGALGLALRVRLKEPSKIARNGRRVSTELTDIAGFLITPVRPGAVVAEVQRRGLPVG